MSTLDDLLDGILDEFDKDDQEEQPVSLTPAEPLGLGLGLREMENNIDNNLIDTSVLATQDRKPQPDVGESMPAEMDEFQTQLESLFSELGLPVGDDANVESKDSGDMGNRVLESWF